MGEIKSAREIAQEKADSLGKLTSTERKKQKEGKCRQIGDSIVKKYLAQDDTRFLEFELSKHGNVDKDLIIQAAIKQLIESIDLKNRPMLDKIFQGIVVMGQGTMSDNMSKLKALAQEYSETDDKVKKEIDRSGKEMLDQLGIAGTAIASINFHAKRDWQKKIDQLKQPFEERLTKLKQEMLNSTYIQ